MPQPSVTKLSHACPQRSGESWVTQYTFPIYLPIYSSIYRPTYHASAYLPRIGLSTHPAMVESWAHPYRKYGGAADN